MREATDTLAARAKTTGAQSIPVAKLYVRAGDNNQALDWIERAYEAHDPNMPYLGVVPMWEGLRGLPRFQAMMRKMKLP